MSASQEQPDVQGPQAARVSLSVAGADLASPRTAATDTPTPLARRLDVVTKILGGWIWETDRDHRFVYMSPSVAEFAGKPPEWHYGKTRQELGNLVIRTVDGQSLQEQLEAHTTFGPMDFLRYQGGECLRMRTIGHPQFDAAGEFTGYIGIAFELPAEEVEEADRRTEPRRRTVRAAEIRLAAASSDVACVLVDISASGARIKIPDSETLPDRFRLTVHSLALDRRCALRWRRGGEVGVEFID